MTSRSVRLRVRYDEIDGMGVIHHPNFLIYFEIARTEYMRESGVHYAELERRGFLLVVTAATARYFANVRYDDEIVVTTTVAAMGRATIQFAYRVEDAGGRLLCEGTTEHACVGPDKAKPIRFPPEILALGAKESAKEGSRFRYQTLLSACRTLQSGFS